MKKILKSVITLLAIMLFLNGCKSTDKKISEEEKIKTVNIAISSEANAEKLEDRKSVV